MEDKSEIGGGVVFIDKPRGITSHKVAEIVKKILNVKKAGHTGTLDPNVTGLLIVLIGKVTRLASIFNLDKTYIGVGKLHRDVKLKELRKIVRENFIGKIKQLPPKRSSVKREWRERMVYDFKILEKKEKYFLFKIRCEAGTYVRKLIHDLGQFVGGAHMIKLRRIAIGKFTENLALSINEVKEMKGKAIWRIEEIINKVGLKSIKIDGKQAKRFCYGAWINKKFLNKKEQKKFEKIKDKEKILIWYNKKFLGIGIKVASKIKPDIVIAKINTLLA